MYSTASALALSLVVQEADVASIWRLRYKLQRRVKSLSFSSSFLASLPFAVPFGWRRRVPSRLVLLAGPLQMPIKVRRVRVAVLLLDPLARFLGEGLLAI